MLTDAGLPESAVRVFPSSSVVAVMVGIFIVQNTLATAVMQRRREIAIQRALGMERSRVAWMVMLEASLLAVLGAALGIPLGLGLAQASMGVVQQSVATLYAEIPSVAPHVSPATMVWVALVNRACCACSATIPVCSRVAIDRWAPAMASSYRPA